MSNPSLSNTHPDVDESSLCPGCQKSVVNDSGGVVVAFGNSFFHVQCFRCAKCGNQVNADTNLLLLSDGSPICSNCSYNCNVCGQPILDEAIMTGDDSYHAHCFKCRVCKNLIDDMVFAKTSQGIYCMKCHNDRVAKSRRHHERKKEMQRERERELALARQELDRLAEAGAQNQDDRAGPSSSQSRSFTPPTSSSTSSPYKPSDRVLTSPPERTSSKRGSLRSLNDANENGNGNSVPFSVTVAPPESGHNGSRSSSPALSRHPSNDPRQSTPARNGSYSATTPSQSKLSGAPRVRMESLPLPSISNGPGSLLQRRKSRDDSNLPVDISIDADLSAPTQGLNVPNKRADKRRSINPGLGLSRFTGSPPPVSPTASTRTVTPPTQSANGRDSPRTPSPLREFFQDYESPLAHPAVSASAEMDRQGRTRAASSSAYENPRADPMRPPLRPSATQERVPPRMNSLNSGIDQGRMSPGQTNLRQQHSFDDRRLSPSSLNMDVVDRPGSGFSDRSRPTSPASPSHRVDVPHGVESGTDTEPEPDAKQDEDDAPPAPPPKESKDIRSTKQLRVETARGSGDSERATSLSDEDEEVRVERTSTTTYIAPALPPIRISMNAADFSDLLKSIDGPFKSFDQLTKLSEVGEGTPTATPTTATTTSFLDWSLTKTPTTKSLFSSTRESAGTSPLTSPSPSPSPSPDEELSKKKAALGQESTRRLGHSPNSSISSGSSGMPAKRSISVSNSPAVNGESSSPRSSLDSRSVSQPSPSRARSSSESGYYSQSVSHEGRSSLSTDSVGRSNPRLTLTVPGVEVVKPPRSENEEVVTRRLQEVLSDANDRHASYVKLDTEFVEAIVRVLEHTKTQHTTLKGKLDNIRRASQQYMDGLTVAQAEYDREVKAKRDAEAEVTRLRVLLSGQAVRLSAITSDSKRADLQRQLSEELSNNLSGLERDVSKLKVERDLTLAEVEELSASKSSPNLDPSTDAPLSRTLSVRFDNIKSQYSRELVPLTEQKEILNREVAELKALREQFLEETASLSARNEELAQLHHQYIRQMETAGVDTTVIPSASEKKSNSFDRPRVAGDMLTTSITASSTLSDESIVKITKIDIPETPQSTLKPGKFKWPGTKPSKEMISAPTQAEPTRTKARAEHNFLPLSALRFARCDHCGDKMFGSQHRCSMCNISVHPRCLNHVQTSCTPKASEEPITQIAPLPPSMFGRDLIEQVQADSSDDERRVPIIVEKCIDAVDASALDLEGIYRKTGGTGQSKIITQLFERGDYASFDLCDSDRFNDICSVTSVLKSYFRQLPDPLLTYSLHNEFVAAVGIRDPDKKMEVIGELLDRLPDEHYETLKMLMLHLHRIMEHSEVNLMTARNLGVVFGPTLMRSRDAGAEFSDMGAKAMSVEWLVENAPVIFAN
ncbi:RhoGAP-domain-containing protein [Neolentinus lepideus HHB14362 ss-1]|uniref:RhoGAP-domain-containing protein n=1 Tax=Neolentinus lepideus HHB14362 ss-1 TaxID=1314782 RepID=A0A165PR69_9AGAM|nr:RhoGAP-domain-containing protein [Neolentinus lepideus HHB14362 ss-1]